MGRNTINIVIVLAVISLMAIVGGQVYWVKNAYTIQEKQFNDRVIIALNDVVEEILEMNNDSSVTQPVYQKESNFYIANINETPSPYLLEELLKVKFAENNLTEVFEYGIYDCYTDSIVLGGRVDPTTPDLRHRSNEIQHKYGFEPDGHYFGVLFPGKSAVLLKQLDFWLYSSILLMLIIIFFTYTISALMKQKRLSEVKTDFINNMTHEFKTPISTIALSTEVLSGSHIHEDPKRLQQYVQIIRYENNRLKSQVEKVLQIATMSPKTVNIQLQPVNIHLLLEQVCETFQVQVEERSGKLDVMLSAENYILMGDQVHLTNIVFNLLDNALKYSTDNPHISVNTKNERDRLIISISDNGIGIPLRQQKMIFDKFYRVPTGDLHDVKGFGLGLYYVNSIVKAHKGAIDLRSAVGRGSTFRLHFKPLIK